MKQAKQSCVLLVTPRHSYRISPYIKAAEQLKLTLLLVSEGKHSLISAVASGIQIKFDNPEEAVTKVQEAASPYRIRAVIGTDDMSVALASRIASHFDLQANSAESARITQRKDLARQRLAAAGLAVPDFRVLNIKIDLSQQLKGFQFPGVIKPLMLSGSRGVIRVNSLSELKKAVSRVAAIISIESVYDVYETSHLLLESYLPGKEIAVEGILSDGRFRPLAVFDKPAVMEGPFFEETTYISPSKLTEATLKKVYDYIQSVCRAYGVRQGPVHAELRINQSGLWLIEMASRTIGGQCAQIMQWVLGESIESLILKQAVGIPITLAEADYAVGVMMIPISKPGILRRVENLSQALKVEFIENIEITIASGNELVCIPEGDSYLGFIFSRAPKSDQVEKALNQAFQVLNIVVSDKLPVISQI